MSFIVHDLYCVACDSYDRSVFYRRSDGRPDCSQCGGARRVCWLDPPRITPTWEPIHTATGTIETRAQFEKMTAKVRKDNPGYEIRICGDSDRDKSRRGDEARHRHLTNLKSKGYSEVDVRERKAEIKAKKLERLARK